MNSLLDEALWDAIQGHSVASTARRRRLTAANWPTYRAELRERLLQLLAPFPERVPLRPRITGELERERYRVERLLFDSRADFPVTANLYLPTDREGPFPAVLVPSTGAVEGKSYASYQAVCQGLVQKGFAVLVYDSVGMGERGMYLNPANGEDTVPKGQKQRRMDAHRALVAGSCLVSWEVWDGMRALDYLESRPEVDPSRIGSAGGRLVALLGAVDERIQVIAAAGGVGTLRHRFQRNASLDPAWVLPGAASHDIDDIELLALFAPRPLLLAAPREDDLLLEGARETHSALEGCYELLGDLDRLSFVELYAPPGFSRLIREEIYAWMQRWLLPGSFGAAGRYSDLLEVEIYPEAEETLWSTPQGQALLSPGGETVYRSLCVMAAEREETSPYRAAAEIERPSALQEQIRLKLRQVTRLDDPDPEILERGWTVSERAASIRFRAADGRELTARLLMPPEPPSRLLLSIPGDGVEAATERLRAAARVSAVFALEPTGLTATPERIDDLAYFGVVLDRPLLGIWLADVLAAIAVVRKLPETRQLPLTVHGTGIGGILAVMAGALSHEVGAVQMEESLLSYRAYLRHPHPDQPPAVLLPGGVEIDLPAIAAAIAPRGFVLAAPLDPSGARAELAAAVSEYALTGRIYRALGADGQFRIDLSPGL